MLRWDPERAQKALDFFPEVLRLSQGEHEGKPFVLLWWQTFTVGSVFGWMRWNPDHRDWFRRFKVVFIETGKGSGKSPLAAGIGLYMLTADNENRPHVFSAATNKDQARVLFDHAVSMVRQSPELANRLDFSGAEGKEWNIAYIRKGGYFKPIASEARGRGKSGFMPHCVLLDEVHEHPTGNMVEFMIANLKSRTQPLVFMITNSGSDKTSICWEYHQYAVNVCKGATEDDEFFGFVCDLPEGADPMNDESVWALANPSLGTTITYDYLRRQVRQAQGMPSKEGVVLRLNFCVWTGAEKHWIGDALWEAVQADFLLESLKGFPCWLGLDLSSKRDLTSLTGIWDVNGVPHGWTWFWTPADTMDERAGIDHVPYRVWADQGFLVPTPGPIVDQDFVARHVLNLTREHDVRGLAFDQAGMEIFQKSCDVVGLDTWIYEGPPDYAKRKNLPKPGLMLRRHGQGFGGWDSERTLWMPGSIEALETAVVNKAIRIRRNPVLTWNSASAVLKADEAGNRKWEKAKSTGRIDGIVSLTQAIGLASKGDETKPPVSVYEELARRRREQAERDRAA